MTSGRDKGRRERNRQLLHLPRLRSDWQHQPNGHTCRSMASTFNEQHSFPFEFVQRSFLEAATWTVSLYFLWFHIIKEEYFNIFLCFYLVCFLWMCSGRNAWQLHCGTSVCCHLQWGIKAFIIAFTIYHV